MINNEIKIVYKKLNELKPYEKNPRQITKKAVKAVMESIRSFGIKVPLVIDKDNVVVCGHTRLKAIGMLKIEDEDLMNWDKIPCTLADDLDENQIRAFRLVDNKTSEFSLWDEQKLDYEFEQIDTLNMQDYGFDLMPTEMKNDKRDQKDIDEYKAGRMIKCPDCGFVFEL